MKICPCCGGRNLIENKHRPDWLVCIDCGVKIMKEHVKDDDKKR